MLMCLLHLQYCMLGVKCALNQIIASYITPFWENNGFALMGSAIFSQNGVILGYYPYLNSVFKSKQLANVVFNVEKWYDLPIGIYAVRQRCILSNSDLNSHTTWWNLSLSMLSYNVGILSNRGLSSRTTLWNLLLSMLNVNRVLSNRDLSSQTTMWNLLLFMLSDNVVFYQTDIWAVRQRCEMWMLYLNQSC